MYPNNVSTNEECPVCLEKGPMFPLSCFHQAHLSCLSGMVENICPICRSPILNLPSIVKHEIQENKKRYQEEQDEETRRALSREMNTVRQVVIPPMIHVSMAIAYLRDIGIPTDLIPSVTVTLDPTWLMAGNLFFLVVNSICEPLYRNLNTEEEDVESEDSSDTDEYTCKYPTTRIIEVVPSSNYTWTRGLSEYIFGRMEINISDLPPLDSEVLQELGISELKTPD